MRVKIGASLLHLQQLLREPTEFPVTLRHAFTVTVETLLVVTLDHVAVSAQKLFELLIRREATPTLDGQFTSTQLKSLVIAQERRVDRILAIFVIPNARVQIIDPVQVTDELVRVLVDVFGAPRGVVRLVETFSGLVSVNTGTRANAVPTLRTTGSGTLPAAL